MPDICGTTTMLAIAAIGAILGLRFKVFVLVPAIVLSSVASCTIGIAHGNSLWSILLVVFFVATALQIGYFAGTAILFGVARVRARKLPSRVIAVAQRR